MKKVIIQKYSIEPIGEKYSDLESQLVDTESSEGELVDSKSLEYETCVICFENVGDESADNFKFSCEHKKYMHTSCITALDKCPLCRIKSLSPVSDRQKRLFNVDGKIFTCFVFSAFICLLLFVCLQGVLMFSLGNYSHNIYNNTNISNNTNITDYK